jgi:hypothetical protein
MTTEGASDRVADAAQDRHAVQLGAIGGLFELFERQGNEAWLFGGWAVDFHAGRVTRTHDDIDIAIWQADAGSVDGLLQELGWEHKADPGEDGYAAYRQGALTLDLAFLTRDADGVVSTPLLEGRGEWSVGAFDNAEVVELLGVSARVVSVDSLLADKTGHRDDESADRKDRADVAVLSGLAGAG